MNLTVQTGRPLKCSLSPYKRPELRIREHPLPDTLAPLKVQLTVNQFDYLCNDGMWVNDCSMKVNMELNVIDGDKTFRKPFGASETRRVATAPVADYNQEWVNAMLENIWERMFSDPEFRAFVGVQ